MEIWQPITVLLRTCFVVIQQETKERFDLSEKWEKEKKNLTEEHKKEMSKLQESMEDEKNRLQTEQDQMVCSINKLAIEPSPKWWQQI